MSVELTTSDPARPTRRDSGSSVGQARLWSALSAARRLDEGALPWAQLFLAREAGSMPGTVRRIEVWARTDQGDRLVAQHPAGAGDDAARPVAALAIGENRGVGQPGTAEAVVAHPFGPAGAASGAVAVVLANVPEAALRPALRRLQWALGPLTALAARDTLAAARAAPALALTAQKLLLAFTSRPALRAGAGALTTELADALGAQRASLGLARRRGMRVLAVSHSAKDARRHALERSLAALMDEAADQRAILAWPAPEDDPNVTLAHRTHARAEAVQAVLTVPLLVEDRRRGPVTVGALVVERTGGPAFTEDDLALADGLADILAPCLQDRRRLDRALPLRAASALWRGLGTLLGPSLLGAKLIALALTLGTVSAALTPAPYRVAADAVLEGARQQAVTVPQDGFLAEAPARPGDTVSQGQVLARLDDRDLVLQRLQLSSERRGIELDLERAVAEGDSAAARVARAQIAAADARAALIEAQRARTVLAAPFDGVVVSGDHSQRLAAAVSRGEVLFEIAPRDAYRIALSVPEDQLGDIAAGQTGRVRLAALPDAPQRLTLTRITPQAQVAEGRTVFRVEAALDPGAPLERLRPGLRGVAQIDAGQGTLLQNWTRGFRAWAATTLWRWTG